jgi:transposase
MEYIGIDVHQRESQVCIVDEDGHVLLERRVRTRGERFAALLDGRDRARVVLEASTESECVTDRRGNPGHGVEHTPEGGFTDVCDVLPLSGSFTALRPARL